LDYPDESLHPRLILGGSCILAANVWILLRPPGTQATQAVG
jgi:hypothetical protein